MEKPKRWQVGLILGVILLTVYNILPTLFYYARPLKRPIDQPQAEKTAERIIERVNSLEPFTLSWLKAESKNLSMKPTEIRLDQDNPRLAYVDFKEPAEAARFAQVLFRAGALIPFVPAELTPDASALRGESTEVAVQRKIGIHLTEEGGYFRYIPKAEGGTISPLYRSLVFDRMSSVISSLSEGSENLRAASARLDQRPDQQQELDEQTLLGLAKGIVEYEKAFGESSPIARRYFASFTASAGSSAEKRARVEALGTALAKLKDSTAGKIQKIRSEESELKKEGGFLDEAKLQSLEALESEKNRLEAAQAILKRNSSSFAEGKAAKEKSAVASELERTFNPSSRYQVYSLDGENPFVKELKLDWKKETVELVLYPEVVEARAKAVSEKQAIQQEMTNQLLYQEIARATRVTGEKITPAYDHFNLALSELTGSSGFLALDLKRVASEQIKTLIQLIEKRERFTSTDLVKERFPISAVESLDKESISNFGLVFYAPVLDEKPAAGFKNSSIYAIAKGLGAIAARYEKMQPGRERELFEKDFGSLVNLFHQNGFIGYRGSDAALGSGYKDDFIFELDDFFAYLIAATRENFTVKGSREFALLEFTDFEQRLLTENRIDTTIQEDLLRWKDDYEAAKVSADPTAKLYVPKPTQSPLLSNLALGAKLYFRGDDRKILRWGLDLSGGKTVRIGLKDQSGRQITDEADLKQAIDELYLRVNKLGVSEVGMRSEGSTIVLDFPGSQGLSAQDLVKASSMTFNVVNEKFGVNNAALKEAVNAFLEEVWNEAVITGRKDIENLNLIAWQHLGGNPENPEQFRPLSTHARLLYDQGLRLAAPRSAPPSSSFNDTLSKVAMFRSTNASEWQGQTHPLLFVFNNYAVEGSNLDNIQTGYDSREGNVLTFGVKSSATKDKQRTSPRDDFYTWTSQFAEEKIAGTTRESYSAGRGWRMAVILNGSVVSAPVLNAALRDSARITGHFSQREINQLAADLKAGSLSFTPFILSEENVSPDLGQEQRTQGIMAAVLGLILVIATMVIYYRFGGVVASIAVLFNLLIIWAVLQNLGAALTLPGIAGIILTIGMSVDANVLVFERIREEFAISKKLSSALFAGYRKAFSAIIDSNLTTIIAALILLNFDSGPIKGFALTLIIGTISSMFTALFMTRTFFAGWIQNPKNKELKMMHFFEKTNFNFLSKARLAMVLSALVIVIGLALFYSERRTVLGMDFTGGYALTVDLVESPEDAYRVRAEKALEVAGVSSHDLQIRELSRPTELRIQLSSSLNEKGKSFYQIEENAPQVEKPLFAYQDNPRIIWIVEALKRGGLELNPESLNNLNLHWTEMSGQLSDAMRNQALFGLLLALIAILIYITVRFEFKYAISATIGLVHDILLTMALFAVIHLFYPGLVFDLQVIAALMTIIGYSLNDTIIVFDRIREDLKLHRKTPFAEIVNQALNSTLSRTVMTSGTTVLALLALVLFGGPAIFNFSLVMLLGVLLGTLSSLYIASPLLLYFHKREENGHQEKGKAPSVAGS